MSEVAVLIADMVRAGVDPDLIGRTAAALSQRETVLVPDEAADRRRAKDAERKRLRKSAEIGRTEDDPTKEASPAPLEEKTEPPKENTPLRGVQKKRGQRLPSDFAMPDEWRDWAIGRGLPAARVPIEFEKLCNWAANAGSKGVKSDWFRAWQNWVLSAIDALPQNRAPPASLAAPSMSQLLTAIRDRPNAIEPEPPEDRSGFRQAIPHLRAVGAG